MTPQIKKKRDEAWLRFNDHPKSDVVSFREGFREAYALMLEETKPLVEALEAMLLAYDVGQKSGSRGAIHIARETFAQHKERFVDDPA